MAIKAIAHSYWRRIKAGARYFSDVPESVKNDVRELASEEVLDGAISQADYDRLIGEADEV